MKFVRLAVFPCGRAAVLTSYDNRKAGFLPLVSPHSRSSLLKEKSLQKTTHEDALYCVRNEAARCLYV